MRTIIIALILIIPLNSIAQCNYYYLQNNKTVTMAIYDRKGSQSGKCVYKISGMTKSGSMTNANVQSEVFDKKGKSIGGGKGTIHCKNGQLMMDMKMMLNPQQIKNVNVDGKGAYLDYPASLEEGQTLNDASFKMDMEMESGMTASVSLDITNRKVAGKEKITTPAGTWDAYKITYNSKTVMYIGIAMPVNLQMTEWFVPGFGVVKSASKWGTTELISIE